MKANVNNSNNRTSRKANNQPNMNKLIDENKTQHRSLDEQASECIDNSISDFDANGVGNTILIDIVEEDNDVVTCVVADNGNGIANIDEAATYGHTDNAQTAKNAHGFGPWQIDAEYAKVETTHNGCYSYIEAPFVVGVDIWSEPVPEDLPHGTRWTFQIKRDYLRNEIFRIGEDHGAAPTNDFIRLCSYFAENLGVRFSSDLRKHPEYRIIVNAKGKDTTTRRFTVEPLYPVFETEATPNGDVPKYTEGHKTFPSYHTNGHFDADFRVGAARPNRPSLLGYFAPGQASQCWYIELANRIITRTDGLSDIKVKHNDFNGMIGIVSISAATAQDAPYTLPSKNHFQDKDFTNLKKSIFNLVPGLTHVLKQYKAKETFHSILCYTLATNLRAANASVLTEYMVDEVTEEKMDVVNFTNRCAYEVKTSTAGVVEVNQVYGYVESLLANASPLVPCPIDTVYLAAQKFADGALAKINRYNAFLEKTGEAIRIVPIALAEMDEINYKELRTKFYSKNKK